MFEESGIKFGSRSSRTPVFNSTNLEQVADVVHILREALKTTQFVSPLACTLQLQATCADFNIRE